MTGYCPDCGGTACICPVPSAATDDHEPWVYGDPMTPARLARIRQAANGPYGVTDEMADDLLAEVARLRSELHDANVAAVGAAMLRQNTLKERDALREAMERIAYGPCEPGCYSERGSPCICWLDVARRALAGRGEAVLPDPLDGEVAPSEPQDRRDIPGGDTERGVANLGQAPGG